MKKALFLLLLLISLFGCVNSKPATDDAGAAPSTASASAKVVGSPQAAATSTAFTVAQCESLLIDAERKLSSARSRAATACKKDDDCQLIETSACIPACVDRAVAKTAVEPYRRAREELRMSSCKLWNDAECPRTTPKPSPECPPMKAVCKAGHCDAVPKSDGG